MFKLKEFLNLREERVKNQHKLIEQHKLPLVVIRANYPGENKNLYLAHDIVAIFRREMLDILGDKVVNVELKATLEGKSYFLVVDMDPMVLKKIAMELEDNHHIGRCIDIDIYTEEKKEISRMDLGFSKRDCFLCENLAFICHREKTHSEKEIKKEIERRYREYKKYRKSSEEHGEHFGDMALKSVILEASSHPSFGLVSPITQGAHQDMNYFDFLESAIAIRPFLKKMAVVGYSPISLELIFKKIRNIGLHAEEAMYDATNGINTHKGMIFLMGVAVTATGKALYEKKEFREIPEIIKEMTRGLLEDFEGLENKENLTNGEKLYLEHGVKGIRGEVIGGMETIFNGGLSTLENSLNSSLEINSAMVQTLLYFMGNLEDSTIIHRHGLKTLEEVKLKSKKILDIGGVRTEFGKESSILLEKEYIEKKISPGGSADCLAVTLFLRECKINIFN